MSGTITRGMTLWSRLGAVRDARMMSRPLGSNVTVFIDLLDDETAEVVPVVAPLAAAYRLPEQADYAAQWQPAEVVQIAPGQWSATFPTVMVGAYGCKAVLDAEAAEGLPAIHETTEAEVLITSLGQISLTQSGQPPWAAVESASAAISGSVTPPIARRVAEETARQVGAEAGTEAVQPLVEQAEASAADAATSEGIALGAADLARTDRLGAEEAKRLADQRAADAEAARLAAAEQAAAAEEAHLAAETKAAEAGQAQATAAEAASAALSDADRAKTQADRAAPEAAAAAQAVLTAKVDRAAPVLAGPLVLQPVPLASLPPAALHPGAQVTVTDAPAGRGAVQSDGLTWRWLADGAPAALIAPGFTFSRAGRAQFVDGLGLNDLPSNAPRLQSNRRLRLDGPRTNLTANPHAVGGGAGKLPDGWSWLGTMPVAATVLGSGVEDGLSYIDVALEGPATGTGAFVLLFDPLGTIPASVGEAYAAAVHVTRLSGSSAGHSAAVTVRPRSASAGLSPLISGTTTPSPGPLRDARKTAAGTVTASGTTQVVMGLQFQPTAMGAAISVVYRISTPTLERASFVSAPVLPLPGTMGQASRAAEGLTTPFTGAGTAALSVVLPQAASGADQTLVQLDDGSAANRLRLVNPAGGLTVVASRVAGGTTTNSAATSAVTAGTVTRFVLAWDAAGLTLQREGSAPINLAGDMVAGLTTLRLGAGISGADALFGEVAAVLVQPGRAASSDFAALFTQLRAAEGAPAVQAVPFSPPGGLRQTKAPTAPEDVANLEIVGRSVQSGASMMTVQNTRLAGRARPLVQWMQDWVNASDYGEIVGDGVADDTAALQAAINALQGQVANGRQLARLRLPGRPLIRASGLVVTRPITIDADGRAPTRIYHPATSAVPCLTFKLAHNGTEWGSTIARVEMRNVTILGEDPYASAGRNVAHGVAILGAEDETKRQAISYNFHKFSINGVAGKGFYWPPGAPGSLTADEFSSINSYGHCSDITSHNDINIDRSAFASSKSGVSFLASGSGQLTLVQTNVWSSKAGNVHLFDESPNANLQIAFDHCSIDRSETFGLFFDIRSPNSVVNLSDTWFRINGWPTPGQHSDIVVGQFAAPGVLHLNDGVQFEECYSDNPARHSKFNIEFTPDFDEAAAPVVYVSPNVKFNGAKYRPSISNRRDLVRTKGAVYTRADGVTIARDLPTTAPAISGALWVDGGVLKRTP